MSSIDWNGEEKVFEIQQLQKMNSTDWYGSEIAYEGEAECTDGEVMEEEYFEPPTVCDAEGFVLKRDKRSYVEKFEITSRKRREKRIAPDDFFKLLTHKYLCSNDGSKHTVKEEQDMNSVLEEKAQGYNKPSKFDSKSLIKQGTNPSNQVFNKIQHGFYEILLQNINSLSFISKSVAFAELDYPLKTLLEKVAVEEKKVNEMNEVDAVANRIAQFYVQGLGFGYLNNQQHQIHFIKKLQNKYIIADDEAHSPNCFLRFCIRVLERLRSKECIRLMKPTKNQLFLKSIVYLRPEWRFTCELHNNNDDDVKSSCTTIEFRYDQTNLKWISFAEDETEMNLEIDWWFYLNEEFFLYRRGDLRKLRRYQTNSYVIEPTKQLPTGGLVGHLNYRWLYRDLYYPKKAQQVEETFDLLCDKHRFFKNLSSELIQHIGSFCTRLIVSQKKNDVKVLYFN
jgi:hypothetical protein